MGRERCCKESLDEIHRSETRTPACWTGLRLRGYANRVCLVSEVGNACWESKNAKGKVVDLGWQNEPHYLHSVCSEKLRCIVILASKMEMLPKEGIYSLPSPINRPVWNE